MTSGKEDHQAAKQRAKLTPRRRPHSESCACSSERAPLNHEISQRTKHDVSNGIKNISENPEPRPLSAQPGPPIPPDGGWGWVVMFASFLVNVIVDGVCFSFGIFYLEFLDHFGASKGKTSWVGSVLNGMYLSMGPVVSALANKFGCRKVSIAGSILATIAYILSTFSPNIDVLIITYGALGGMGFGLMYLPAIVMVGFYFEKRRALATGVAVCGSGIGAFAFAPLSEFLISVYGWKGATYIIAAIVLNGVAVGGLFRPLQPDTSNQNSPQIVIPDTKTDDTDGKDNCVENKALLNNKNSEKKSSINGEIINPVNKHLHIIGEFSETLVRSCGHLPGNKQLETTKENTLCRSMDDVAVYCKTEVEKIKIRELQRPLYRKDIFYSGSISHLPEFQSQKDLDLYHRSITNIPSLDQTDGGQPHNCCVRMCGDMLSVFKEMMDFSLLKNPVFAVYGLSCFLCMLGFFVPFTYLPDFAVGLGISRGKAAFLVSIIGITNTVARVLAGFVSDQPWADCLLINNCALIVGGVATMLCPFCINYGLLGLYSCVFGAAIAVFVSLRSIIMVELLGLDRLTNSFGLVTLCQGLSSFIGAPIAGSLYDWTGSYDISFYAAGSTLAAAGLICLPLRRINRWQQKKSANKPGEHVIVVPEKIIPKQAV